MADTKGTIATATGVTEWTPEIGDLYGVTQDKFKPHAVTKVNLKGVKVGDSAQTTALIGATFKPLKGMRIGLDWSVFARNYANYAISNPSMNDTANYKTPWEIPWGNQFDFNISYGFKVGLPYTAISTTCSIRSILPTHTTAPPTTGIRHTVYSMRSAARSRFVSKSISNAYSIT